MIHETSRRIGGGLSARLGSPRWVRPRERESVARAVFRFVMASVIAVIVLAALGLVVLNRTAKSEAIRDATQLTRLTGQGIVEPALDDALLSGSPAAIARLDRLVRMRVLRGPVVRVKLWTPQGRIVYSDEPRLIGTRSELGPRERAALRTGKAAADVTDLAQPENRYERRWKKLLEVYLPVRTPRGRPLLFESYMRFSSIDASGQDLLVRFSPALLGVLLVLVLIQLPLAASLARRLRARQDERETLLNRAIESSALERRRLIRDIHDGILQRLAGVSFSLSAALRTPHASGRELRPVIAEAASEARRSAGELRNLLVDIYPPDLHRAGLPAALRELMSPLESRGITTSLHVPADLDIPRKVEALLFRTAQEALRNVAVHADARRVELRVTVAPEAATLDVIDDGRGFRPGHNGDVQANPRLGLRLLDDLMRDAGAVLEVQTAPGAGTRLHVQVPLEASGRAVWVSEG
jgi:two-component system, NarL family, sensor kinase